MSARRPRIGKHTLETLTTGMYSNPLDALREYVQNGCDAVDAALRQGLLDEGQAQVEMRIDGRSHSITIRDNGVGLSPAKARAALSDVGRSEKLGTEYRGFRGIGRLGGLGYCEELTFRTKVCEDQRCFVQTWDCRKLQELLSPANHKDLDVVEVIESVSSDHTQDYRGSAKDHFFEVRMIGIHEGQLMDLVAVRAYLAQTAPVAFDLQAFRFGQEIDQYLRRNVPRYATYRIVVNDQVLYKLYRDTTPLSAGRGRGTSEHQRVKEIRYLTLLDQHDSPMACCWIGETELRGTLSSDSGLAGIRLRHGNMLIGDGRTLERAFQRSNRRFAAFLVGEIHAVHEGLVPNARRDDLEFNVAGIALYQAIARQICAPATEEIRHASSNRSRERRLALAEQTRIEAEKDVRQGVVSEAQRTEIVDELQASARDLDRVDPDAPDHKAQRAQIEATAEKIRTEARHVVDAELQPGYDRRTREALKIAFDMLYDDYQDKARAEALIRRIVKRLKGPLSRR